MAVATVEATEAVEVAEGKAAATEAEATEEGGLEVATAVEASAEAATEVETAEAATAEETGTARKGVRYSLYYN